VSPPVHFRLHMKVTFDRYASYRRLNQRRTTSSEEVHNSIHVDGSCLRGASKASLPDPIYIVYAMTWTLGQAILLAGLTVLHGLPAALAAGEAHFPALPSVAHDDPPVAPSAGGADPYDDPPIRYHLYDPKSLLAFSNCRSQFLETANTAWTSCSSTS
jgi:hypothetical protein